MKKVLAVFLAVMMLFSAFTMSSVALSQSSTQLLRDLKASKVITDEQVVLVFDLAGGTLKGKVEVYDENQGFVEKEGITGVYNMIPNNQGKLTASAQIPGRYVILPQVIAPKNYKFEGWYCYGEEGIVPSGTYSAGAAYYIPKNADYVGVIEFFALMVPAPAESGMLDMLLGVFGKVVEAIANALNIQLPEDFDIASILGSIF